MGPAGWGVMWFWIFIAAMALGGMWSEARKRAEKHETLRRIVEKTGTVDEAKLKELFSEDVPKEPETGFAYLCLRIGGMIGLFLGAAVATFFLIATWVGKLFGAMQMFGSVNVLVIGLAVSAAVVVLSLGVFLSSRFAEPPPPSRNEPPAP